MAVDFIAKKNILCNNGFRSNHSIALALSKIEENIASSIDKGQYKAGVFYPIAKLKHAGIRAVTLSYIWKLLVWDDQNQYIFYNNWNSDQLPATCRGPGWGLTE